MAEETATVRLQMIDAPRPEYYLHPEFERFQDEQDHLVVVIFRVNSDRDAFPIRVLMDRREVSDDRLVPAARHRATVMLRAALHALEAHKAPDESPESLGGPP